MFIQYGLLVVAIWHCIASNVIFLAEWCNNTSTWAIKSHTRSWRPMYWSTLLMGYTPSSQNLGQYFGFHFCYFCSRGHFILHSSCV